MNKLALKAVAQLTHVDIGSATRVIRENPILDDEIYIDEEIINLKESLANYRSAADTLKHYPSMQEHLIRENRTIMKHCIGLLARMMQGKKLTHTYSQDDIVFALKRLVQVLLDDAHSTGKRIDREIMEVIRPFMTIRQRVLMREWTVEGLMQVLPLQYISFTLFGRHFSFNRSRA